jgi:uncharacterized membrane protein (UPF0127 family)
MRLLAAAATATVLAQCVRSMAPTATDQEDAQVPGSALPDATSDDDPSVRAPTQSADAAQTTAHIELDPVGAADLMAAMDASTAPVKASPTDASQAVPDATRNGARDASSNVDAARCVQPTPASPPPLVAPATHCPADPSPQADQNLPIVHIVFPDARIDAGGAAVDAELATSQAAMDRGLMYRKSMPANHGMLFEPKLRTNQQFWMHDVCIPLDMVFVDTDGFIAGIVESAAPLSDAIDAIPCPTYYVLEVNGGWTRSHGVKAGQQMTIPAAAR